MPNDADGIFSRRVLGCVIGVSVLSLVVAFVMAAFGENLGGTRTAGNNTFSYSALGHRAASELLGRSGLDVGIRRHPLDSEFGPSVPLVVAEPPDAPLSLEGDEDDPLVDLAIEAWIQAAPLVLVLPKWRGWPAADGKFVEHVELRPAADASEILRRAGSVHEVNGMVVKRSHEARPIACTSRWGEEYLVEIRNLQRIEQHAEVQPVVQCAGKTLIGHLSAPDESSGVFVVADPEILNNHGLGRGEHAALIVDLFGRQLEAEAVVFDETLHGFSRSANLVSEMLRFPMVIVTLHGLLVLGLIVWSGARRFGKPAAAEVRGIDNPRLLIGNAAQLLALGDHASPTLKRYYKQTLRAVGAHFFFAHDMPMNLLQQRLQTITRSRGLEIDLQSLRHEVGAVGSGRRSMARAVSLACDLHAWRMEMTDGIATDS